MRPTWDHMWILSGHHELQMQLSHSTRELEKCEPAVSLVAAQTRKPLQEGLLARLLLPHEPLLQRLAAGPIQSASTCAHRNQLAPCNCMELAKYISELLALLLLIRTRNMLSMSTSTSTSMSTSTSTSMSTSMPTSKSTFAAVIAQGPRSQRRLDGRAQSRSIAHSGMRSRVAWCHVPCDAQQSSVGTPGIVSWLVEGSTSVVPGLVGPRCRQQHVASRKRSYASNGVATLFLFSLHEAMYV